LELLIAGLVETPHCLGLELTVFDPDYDPDGGYAAEIVATLVAGLAPVVTPEAGSLRLLPAQSSAAGRPGLRKVTGPADPPDPDGATVADGAADGVG